MTALSDGFYRLQDRLAKCFVGKDDSIEEEVTFIFSKILMGHLGIDAMRPARAVGYKIDEGFGVELHFHFKAKDADCTTEKVGAVISNAMSMLEVLFDSVIKESRHFAEEHAAELLGVETEQQQGEV